MRKGGNEVEHVSDVEEDLLKQLEVCIKALQRGKKGKKRAAAQEKKAQPDATRKRGVCWGCGLPGHIQRNCTKETTNTTATGNDDAAPPPMNDDADKEGHQGNGQ